jgi:type III pantothenate kinase
MHTNVLLAIDVGNSNTVLGWLAGDQVVRTFRVSTMVRTTDEFGLMLQQLFSASQLDPRQLEGAIISSVVPSVLYSMERACRRYFEIEPLVVGRGVKTGMKVRTDNPREVGADRIVNSVAAVHRWGKPIIVVDFGTATTVDCVNDRGEYVGGAIAPGFAIAEEALFSKTAKLPRVEVMRPDKAIGTNTIHAMQSGLFFGYVGLVDALASRCRNELDPSAKVVATGGMANLMASESALIEEVDPNLTLKGLALLYAMNRG